jgi:uncharacterized protein YrrD
MEEMGRVEVLWMYPQAHRVLGFIGKSGFLGTKKLAFKLIQIDALGSNGIMTHSPPEATDAERVGLLESLLHHEVWSDQGNRIGKITDYLFNLRTGSITHYLLVSSGWAGITGEIYQLAPEQILSFGKKRVLVNEAIVPNLALYREGLRQKLTEVSEFFKEEATQEWRSISRQAEIVTEETKERLQDLTDQTRERAQRLSQTAREQAKMLNEQLQEDSQSWAKRLQAKGQTMARQLKTKTRRLSQQVEDGIETILVQAEELFDSSPSGLDSSGADPFDPDPFEFDLDPVEQQPPESQTLPTVPPANRSPVSSPLSVPEPSPAQPTAPGGDHDDDQEDEDEPWI